MQIPRYWARSEKKGATSDGDSYDLRAWASSEVSEEDAHQKSIERLKKLALHCEDLSWPEKGSYPYSRAAMREKLLQELTDDENSTFAMITRNRYGTRVLNTARCMFLDIDIPAGGLIVKFLCWLRGKKYIDPTTLLPNLQTELKKLSRASFRLYRTAGGYRVLATDREYEPTDAATLAMMETLGTDKEFVKLCKIQDSFRARLTPKPWRIGLHEPKMNFPFETDEEETRAATWLAEYEIEKKGFATCEFLETIGDGFVHPNIAEILELHDSETRAMSKLPLA